MKLTSVLVAGTLAVFLTAEHGWADSLQSAVRAALTSNPQLKAADANFRALTYDLLHSEAGFEPSVRLFGDVGAEYVDDPQGLSAADNGQTKLKSELGVVAELTLFDGFARANRVYAAAARVDQSSFELLDASETMALMVSEQYINVARQQHLLGVAQRNLRRLRQISRQAETLVEGGRLPASDRFQIDAAIFSAQATIADIQRRLVESGARYKRLVGKSAHANLGMPQPVRPPASMEAYVTSAVRSSYRVRIAGSNVDVRGFEQEIAEADFAPLVTLNAGTSLGDNLDGSSGSERRAFVGVGLSWQLYGGKRNERRMGLSERKNEALYQRMAVVREVEELATIAWNGFQMNMIRSDYMASEVRAYQRMVSSYDREFELATRSVLDLLVAENRLYNARFAEVNAAAILSYTGYRALAAQSQLAKHFGVKNSERVMATQIAPSKGQKPRDVISKGRLLIEK